MRLLTLLLMLFASVAHAQSSQAPPPAPPAEAAPAVQKTLEETASPDLVGELAKDLAITPTQAEGTAGALFGVAKSRLRPEDFAKVAGAVPGMEGLLKAAPVDAKVAALQAVTGKSTGLAAVTGSLTKLGLKPETIAKAAPSLIKVVQSKGGAEIGSLLAGALK